MGGMMRYAAVVLAGAMALPVQANEGGEGPGITIAPSEPKSDRQCRDVREAREDFEDLDNAYKTALDDIAGMRAHLEKLKEEHRELQRKNLKDAKAEIARSRAQIKEWKAALKRVTERAAGLREERNAARRKLDRLEAKCD